MNDIPQLYTKQSTITEEQSKQCLQDQVDQNKRNFSKKIRSRITISKGI